ncbi:MAG: hypothetical protein KAV97_01105 [Actinomycetia bacterium]|nr:hypothetical protein [Actinomycetes bacterium]
MSNKLKNIMKKEDREIKLREYLIDLGGSLTSTYTANGKHLEDEVVARIINAERSNREEKLWIIAFISAIASVISALAAWIAVANLLK